MSDRQTSFWSGCKFAYLLTCTTRVSCCSTSTSPLQLPSPGNCSQVVHQVSLKDSRQRAVQLCV
eukprot:1151686-Pelagomonas_calceolata.AAC.8